MPSEGTHTIERMNQPQAPDTQREGGAYPGPSQSSLTITVKMDLSRKYRRRKGNGSSPSSSSPPAAPRPDESPGTPLPPPITRTLAMAIRFDGMVAANEVRDYASLSRIARISRARVTQVMSLLHLAPDIQEQILALPGDEVISEHGVRGVCRELDWGEQRRMWATIGRRATETP